MNPSALLKCPHEWSRGIPPEITITDAEVLTDLVLTIRHRRMVVVEVGSWVGNGSTRIIIEAMREAAQGTLYCVDTWTGSDNVSHHLNYRRQRVNLFRVFAQNMTRYNARHIVQPLTLSSLEASKLFPDKSIDMVFIDGNHGYSHVKEDILAWLPKVKAGGILSGHDCDTSYPHLDPGLRSALDTCLEEDVYCNTSYPGPAVCHAGVVKAVHEVLGEKAKLWFPTGPTTIWSYQKPRSSRDRFWGRVRRCGAWWWRRRLTRARTPWPADVEDDR
jgi:predicted O-methyltransferase YrrM